MLTKMLERVTDAIFPAFEHIGDRDYRRIIAACWARAAIEAMREPTDEMLLAAGRPYEGEISVKQGLELRREAWRKIIDSALSGGHQR